MPADPDIWFPAKKYGYGWGLPCRWQGWLVLAIYVALMIAGTVALIPSKHAAYFVVYISFLGAALVAICAWKGETLRWRWGGK